MDYANKVCVKRVLVPARDNITGTMMILWAWVVFCPHCKGVEVIPCHHSCAMPKAVAHSSGVCSEISKIGV